MQQRKPDLMLLLALVVGLGVVVTTSVHGAEFGGHPVSAVASGSDTASAVNIPGLKSIAGNVGNPVLTLNEVSMDVYGVDVGFHHDGDFDTAEPYVFVSIERRW